MDKLKSMWMAALGLAAVLALAGCGGSGGGGGLYGSGGGGSSPTATTAPAASAIIKTATASVQGKSESILTNAQGMTLYYFDPDTTTSIACSGGCASTWPPVLVPSGATPQASGLSGTLSVLNGANGSQCTYNGHPLYTYSGDSAAGQTNGDGIEGKWHVATPNVAQNGQGSNGYGY